MDKPPTFGERLLGIFGLLVHLAVGAFVYLPFGLIAPLWAHVIMLIAWVLFAAIGLKMMRARPASVAAIPVIALALALIVAAVGDRFAGWSA